MKRNDYDRVAHFMLGFLLGIPIREILMQVAQTSRRWLAFLTASIVLAIGAFYELIEWWVAVLATPNLVGQAVGRASMWSIDPTLPRDGTDLIPLRFETYSSR